MPVLEPELARARILIVDDNPANLSLLESILEDAGYENLACLADPREVLGEIKRTPPALILLDIRMPYLSGHDVLLLIGEHMQLTMPPVIVLTAENDRLTRERALEGGARDFLTKPFDQTEVLQRIRNQLGAHLNTEAHRQRASELEQIVRERTAELRALSLRDPLTGLPNRRALQTRIVERLHVRAGLGCYFVMVDDVEEIARVHGYAMAEAMIEQVGHMLASSVLGQRGMVGAWGSSEFVLLLDQPAQDRMLDDTAGRLLRLLSGELVIDGVSVDLAVRIGVAHSEDASEGADQVIRLAALALPPFRTAVRHRRYAPEIMRALAGRRSMRKALRQAVEQGELNLLYQPKIALESGEVTGAEGLLRWVSAGLGAVSPVEFIPLAEESGEIIAIGEWVIQSGTRQLREWQRGGVVGAEFSLALNVSGHQLMREGFADWVIDHHRELGLARGVLQLEVTESGLMENIGLAIKQLERLAEAGIPAAIDDFGTGYSSLSYLKSLPVAVLKIDRSFVNNINHDPTDLRLVETVVAIAHSLGCEVVAEGIEDRAQAQTLCRLGCETGQGYFYARPLSVDDFVAFMRRSNLMFK